MKIRSTRMDPPGEGAVRTGDTARARQTLPKIADAFEVATSAESTLVPSEQSRRAWLDAAWQCLRPAAAASGPPPLDPWLAKVDRVVEMYPPTTTAPLAFDDRLVAGMADSILNAGVAASPNQVADRLARELPGRTRMAPSAVSSLLVNHRAELEGVLAERWSQRIEQGAERLADLAHRFPRMSLEELRRASATPTECLDRARQIVGSDAERRSTRVDSQGPEPNLLLAIRLAAAMLNAPERISFAGLIEDFCITNADVLRFWPGFDVDAARKLQAAYPIVPRWPVGVSGSDDRKTEDCPSWNSVPTDLRDELVRWCAIPLALESLNKQQIVRREGRFLAGRPDLSVEIATGKSFASLRHHIIALGATGSAMTAIWKPYSELPDGGADPIIPQLCARSLGIRSIEPDDFAELQSTTVAELRRAYQDAEGGAGVVNLHLVGVDCWDELARLAEAHPAVSARVTSHTSFDGDRLPGRLDELGNVVVMKMYDSPAKLAYEPEMLASVFEQMLWKTRELPGLPSLRRLPFLVHGDGKTVGPAMVEAIHGFGIGAEKCGVTDPRAATDPALRLKIEAQHATLVPVERAAEQFTSGLVSVN
ncbi:MAG: hypothetical protein V3T05_11075, partial [Myxococcota bacterium]